VDQSVIDAVAADLEDRAHDSDVIAMSNGFIGLIELAEHERQRATLLWHAALAVRSYPEGP
jgi:hypothetical protein